MSSAVRMQLSLSRTRVSSSASGPTPAASEAVATGEGASETRARTQARRCATRAAWHAHAHAHAIRAAAQKKGGRAQSDSIESAVPTRGRAPRRGRACDCADPRAGGAADRVGLRRARCGRAALAGTLGLGLVLADSMD